MKISFLNNHRNIKFLLIFAFIVAAFILLKPGGKIFADTADCGIESGNVHDFAGLVVDFKVNNAGAISQATNASASVTTSYAPDPDGEVTPDNTDSGHINSVVIHQGTQPAQGGTGNNVCAYNSSGTQVNGYTDLHLAIMGGIYNTTQTPSTGFGYVLDCDHSVGASGGEFNGLSNFIVTGSGVPTNGVAGGWWTSTTIGPENGNSAWVTLTYHDPAPPATPILECDSSQNTYIGDVQENSPLTVQLVIDNYGGTAYFIPPGTAPAPAGQTAEYFYYALIKPDGSTTGYNHVSTSNGPSITAGHAAVLNLTFASGLNPTGTFIVRFKATDGAGNTTYMNVAPCNLHIPVVTGSAQRFVCAPTSNPTYYNENTSYNLNVALQNIGGTTAYFDPPQPSSQTPSERFAYQIVYPSGAISFKGYTGTVTPSPGAVPQNTTSSGIVTFLTPSNPGTYTLQYEAINNDTGAVDQTDNCNTPLIVTAPPTLPYFEVQGGNVQAGINYGNCSQYNAATIKGNNTGSPSYSGASGQLAALATDNNFPITGFNSAENPNHSAVFTTPGNLPTNPAYTIGPPIGLTFANDQEYGPPNVFVGQLDHGGNYPSCVLNYFSLTSESNPLSIPNGSTIGGGSGLTSGTYVYNSGSNLTLNTGGGIAPGTQITIVVKGGASVYITSGSSTSESYQPYSMNPIGNIPRLELIVDGGNIYVDKSVTALEGTFIAQPDSSNNYGAFITCSNSTPHGDTTYGDCNNNLQITGSVSANQLEMLRSNGNSSSNTPAAETYIYGPEDWLPEVSSQPTNFTSIVSLPPVL